MTRVSELPIEEFDGVKRGYVPPRELRIHESLRLHRDAEGELDPVTYEVVRHNLWNINEEHGSTIQRISGSPVAMYALDLNPSILCEDGEFVYFGPYMQYMSGVTDTQVKWILEHRSDNPGIRDGDMYLANDPWVGAAHQMDVMLIAPVFHEGELFCWVTNCLHQYDIGGITPASSCPSAETAFDEGILIPHRPPGGPSRGRGGPLLVPLDGRCAGARRHHILQRPVDCGHRRTHDLVTPAPWPAVTE